MHLRKKRTGHARRRLGSCVSAGLWLLALPAFLAGQELKLDVVERTLKNGMKVLMVERHDSPTVALYLRFRVGGVDDPQGKTGIAHLLEHMMFKGTTTYGTTDYEAEIPLMEKIDQVYAELQAERRKLDSPFEKADEGKISQLEQQMATLQEEQKNFVVNDELWQTYQRLGGVALNASTGNDSTQYFVQLPSNQLEVWAYLEADRLANPVFREFYAERDVVHEERRMRTDTQPPSLLWETFRATAFLAHSYRNPIIGWPSDIDNLTREEVLRYFQTFYAPNNCIVAIVGDIDPSRTMTILEKYFEPIPAQTLPARTITEEPPQRGERRTTLVMDAQPQLHIGYHIPQIGHEDSYALDVLGQLLGGVDRGSRTGRLYRSLVLEKKVALGADASAETSLYPNLFVISVTPAQGKTIEEVERAVYEEIRKLETDPPTDVELTRVRNAADASLVRALRTNFGIARVIASVEHVAGDWRYLFEERDRIKAVTAEQVQQAAKKYLNERNRTVAELRPPPRSEAPRPATPAERGEP
ncbi:MAG: insulinase family protein [Acidobacteria bacterium]|nr:insulinase family protein [Acidobacteriota bacterium]